MFNCTELNKESFFFFYIWIQVNRAGFLKRTWRLQKMALSGENLR